MAALCKAGAPASGGGGLAPRAAPENAAPTCSCEPVAGAVGIGFWRGGIVLTAEPRWRHVCFYEPVAGAVGIGFWRGGIVLTAEPRWRRVLL